MKKNNKVNNFMSEFVLSFDNKDKISVSIDTQKYQMIGKIIENCIKNRWQDIIKNNIGKTLESEDIRTFSFNIIKSSPIVYLSHKYCNNSSSEICIYDYKNYKMINYIKFFNQINNFIYQKLQNITFCEKLDNIVSSFGTEIEWELNNASPVWKNLLEKDFANKGYKRYYYDDNYEIVFNYLKDNGAKIDKIVGDGSLNGYVGEWEVLTSPLPLKEFIYNNNLIIKLLNDLGEGKLVSSHIHFRNKATVQLLTYNYSYTLSAPTTKIIWKDDETSLKIWGRKHNEYCCDINGKYCHINTKHSTKNSSNYHNTVEFRRFRWNNTPDQIAFIAKLETNLNAINYDNVVNDEYWNIFQKAVCNTVMECLPKPKRITTKLLRDMVKMGNTQGVIELLGEMQ